MREAFVYMFKDNCFWKKAIVYLMISFIAGLLISYSQISSCAGMCPIAPKPTVITVVSITPILLKLAGIFINMIIVGYFLSSIKAISKQSNNIVLPFFNIGNNFIKGFKFNLTILGTIIFYSFLIGLLFSFYNTLLLAKVLCVILLVFYLIYGTAFVWSFAQEEKFTTFFNFKNVVIKTKENIKNYIQKFFVIFCVILFSIILSYVIELFIANLFNSIILAMIVTTLITTIFATYVNFVTMFLIAKSIKEDSIV